MNENITYNQMFSASMLLAFSGYYKKFSAMLKDAMQIKQKGKVKASEYEALAKIIKLADEENITKANLIKLTNKARENYLITDKDYRYLLSEAYRCKFITYDDILNEVRKDNQ